jgi:hypothetical protein
LGFISIIPLFNIARFVRGLHLINQDRDFAVMTDSASETVLVSKKIQVSCNIVKVNHYLRKTRQLAVHAITPVYGEDQKSICGFNLYIEGPERQVSYFSRLLSNPLLF